jgi:hypothetical protein
MSNGTKDLGPLGRSALGLESDFKEMDRLSAALMKFPSGEETNLEHAQKLLEKFGEVGLRIANELQALAAALDDGRLRAEAATHEVAKSAAFIQKRSQQRAEIAGRFQALGKRVQGVSVSLVELGQNSEQDAEKAKLLTQLQEQLASLANEAITIKEEARDARFKELERQAETMADRLRLSGKKIKKIVEAGRS